MTKPKALAVAALAAFATAATLPANAKVKPGAVEIVRRLATMPPAKFDVPYDGVLTIWLIPFQSEQLLKEICRGASRIACAIHLGNIYPTPRCDIYMLDHTDTPREMMVRHEIAHCNGWPGDHPDKTLVDITKGKPVPKLPASTRWLPGPPKVVCITPDRTVEPCESRKPFWSEGGNAWATPIENLVRP
jgi:hypothetical protein